MMLNVNNFKPMKNRLFASLTLVLVSLFLVGCSSDNVMQDASQVTNLQEVDFSVFSKTLDDIPTPSASSRADEEASSVPLSKTDLFTELEVVLIPVNEVNKISYYVRQLSTDDNFGEAKLYVPQGDYYLVAVAAKTKNPTKGHQITIKSTTEVDFPENIVTDMAYNYQKVSVGTEKQSVSVPLKRAVAALRVVAADLVSPTTQSFEVTFDKGVGSVFNPSTGFCDKEEKYTRNFDISDKVNWKMTFTVYVLLPKAEEKDASVTFRSIDTSDKTIKSTTFNDVHLVYGKRTSYQGPLFTPTTSASFTFSEGSIDDADEVHTFE